MKKYDLEEQIMECWNVVDDIALLRARFHKMDEDGLDNFLLGLEVIYQEKFERMFDTFGDTCFSEENWRNKG